MQVASPSFCPYKAGRNAYVGTTNSPASAKKKGAAKKKSEEERPAMSMNSLSFFARGREGGGGRGLGGRGEGLHGWPSIYTQPACSVPPPSLPPSAVPSLSSSSSPFSRCQSNKKTFLQRKCTSGVAGERGGGGEEKRESV